MLLMAVNRRPWSFVVLVGPGHEGLAVMTSEPKWPLTAAEALEITEAGLEDAMDEVWKLGMPAGGCR